MLIGMEYVAREIHFYTLFEVVYLTRSSEARDQLANTLVETYAKLFGFLAEARDYYSEHTITRFAKAIFNEGGLKRTDIDPRNEAINCTNRWS